MSSMILPAVFIATYAGIAVGRVPGLAIDRVGIALLGAIAMVVFGGIRLNGALAAIDWPTILLLYSLMIVSAQLRLGGFYTWSALRIMRMLNRPKRFLLSLMLASAVLSAILANDIVCFAFAPVLALSLVRAGLNPVPFLIGLAVSSNIGSAATIIGNPQNMLIGQVGRLEFGEFFLWCAPPSAISLVGSYLVILGIYRKGLHLRRDPLSAHADGAWPEFDAWQTGKGLAAVGVLIALFLTPVPREISAIGVAGVLLCSRRMATRDILGLVDWHLITLFCALFVIIHGITLTGLPDTWVAGMSQWGLNLHNLDILSALSAVLSNAVSNVPAAMLLIRFLDAADPVPWYTLALSSTFAGNLILIGSIANLIVAEQAAAFNIRISFREHAATGIPVTLLSLLVLVFWNHL